MNKLKFSLMLSIAVVLLLAWGVSAEINSNSKLEVQIAELNSKLKDKSAQQALEQNKQNFELQGKCYQQAQSVFLQLGYKNVGMDSFESHYNSKMNKCLILIDSTNPQTLSNFQNLFDAYEQKVYATYFWMGDKNKKHWEVPPKECTLNPNLPNETVCKSTAEFNHFVTSLMNG